MARQKKATLGDQPEKKITEEFLKENPVGVPDELPKEELVVTAYIPKYEDVVFVNQRDAGVPLEFHYKTKTHPMKHYKLVDGETYTLPQEVIDHLQSCSIPMYGKEEMKNGVMFRPVIAHKYMFAFRNPKTFRRTA